MLSFFLRFMLTLSAAYNYPDPVLTPFRVEVFAHRLKSKYRWLDEDFMTWLASSIRERIERVVLHREERKINRKATNTRRPVFVAYNFPANTILSPENFFPFKCSISRTPRDFYRAHDQKWDKGEAKSCFCCDLSGYGCASAGRG